jgi:N-acetylneuraminic acid mutarotase
MQMNPASAPSIRSSDGFAYDAESDRVILFGGLDYKTFGRTDTWAYDYNTNTWKEMAKGPANHLGARLAYDAESDRIVLFGGLRMETFRYVNTTWAFDFNTNTWTEMKPKTSPPGRNFQAMTYDSKADRVLTWGCFDENGEKPVDESMWAYDFNTNTWTEMKPDNGGHPAGRDFTQMVYDAKADRTILYGGTRGGTETWAFDYNTNTWMKLEPTETPDGIEEHGMVYNSSADRVILFGGFDNSTGEPLGETWSYDFNTDTWTNMTPKP